MAETGWCPNCGSEYRPGITTCPDCGVRLMPRPPDSTVEERDDPNADRGPVEYDLGDWPEDARHDLQWMLNGRNIPYEWVDETVLVVPETRADEVDAFLDYIAAEPSADDAIATNDWRVTETTIDGAPTELSIDDFYDGDPARQDSDEVEFGREWSDADGVQCEVSWVHDTGELFIMHAFRWQPYMVEIVAVTPSEARVEQLLDGWEDAMSRANSVQWVRDKVRAGSAQTFEDDRVVAPTSAAETSAVVDDRVSSGQSWWDPPASVGWIEPHLDDLRAAYLLARDHVDADAALEQAIDVLDDSTRQQLTDFFDGEMDVVYGDGTGAKLRRELLDALERQRH